MTAVGLAVQDRRSWLVTYPGLYPVGLWSSVYFQWHWLAPPFIQRELKTGLPRCYRGVKKRPSQNKNKRYSCRQCLYFWIAIFYLASAGTMHNVNAQLTFLDIILCSRKIKTIWICHCPAVLADSASLCAFSALRLREGFLQNKLRPSSLTFL